MMVCNFRMIQWHFQSMMTFLFILMIGSLSMNGKWVLRIESNR